MKTKLFFVIAFQFHLLAFMADAQKYYIDCSPDSVKKITMNARTPGDTLYALVAKIENMGENPDNSEFISSVNLMVRLNSRLKLLDTRPYELFRDGIVLWNKNRTTEGIGMMKKSIAEFDRHKRIMGYNSLFARVRIYYTNSGLIEERDKYYREKLRYYQEHGPVENMAICYHVMSRLLLLKADYNNAINYYLRSAEAFKPFSLIGYSNEICVVGYIYYIWGNFERAQYYLQTGYGESIRAGSWELAAFARLTLSLINKKKTNYKEALLDITDALNIYYLHPDEIVSDYKAVCLAEKGSILLELNRPAEALQSLKDAISIRDSVSIGVFNSAGYFEGEYYMYKYYHSKGDRMMAEKHLLTAYQKVTEIKDDGLVMKYSKELVGFYSGIGRPGKAIQYALSYITLSDSIRGIENGYNVAQFENEQKDLKAYQKLQKQKLLRNIFIGGFAVVLLFALVFFHQRNKIHKEKMRSETEQKRSEELLLNILPYEVAEELKSTGSAKAKTFSMVSVMFTDFKDFTSVSEKVSGELLVDEIHQCFSAFDTILQKYKIEKIKTIGDAYMCASGLPVLNYTHAVDIVNAAFEFRDFMATRKIEKQSRREIPFELRIGIHTGPVVAGIVGVKKFQYDIWGDTVNIASRMESCGEPGKVNISGSTYNLVKDQFTCTYRGKIQAKNKGEIDMYFVESSTI